MCVRLRLCAFYFRLPNVKIVKQGCTSNVCATEAGHLEERQSREIFSRGSCCLEFLSLESGKENIGKDDMTIRR